MKKNDTPALQRWMDNIWLLFLLGVAIFFISYIAWGIYQVGQVQEMPKEIKESVLSE